jgi:hypothetical protein
VWNGEEDSECRKDDRDVSCPVAQAQHAECGKRHDEAEVHKDKGSKGLHARTDEVASVSERDCARKRQDKKHNAGESKCKLNAGDEGDTDGTLFRPVFGLAKQGQTAAPR